MTSIYVVRHGEVVDNSVYYGRLEAELSEKGKETSKRVAASLAGKDISKVLTSSMPRAAYMAFLISESCKCPIDSCWRIDAKEYGEWAGKKKDEVKRKNYNDLEVKWLIHGAGGESYADVAERVAPLLEDLANSDQGNVVLVTHEGVMKVIYSILNLDRAGINKRFRYGDFFYVPDLAQRIEDLSK